MYSRAVSNVRQPIELLFNSIIEKTGIQRASRVHSTKGLFVHFFGRIAAAFIFLILTLTFALINFFLCIFHSENDVFLFVFFV